MFRVLKKEINCLYCEDENINKLPSVSQLNIVKALLPNQRIKKEDVLNFNERFSCYLLIAGEIYSFSCDFNEAEEDTLQMVDIDIKPYNFGVGELSNDKNTVSQKQKVQLPPKLPSSQEKKEPSTSKPLNYFDRRVYNLMANIKKEQIKEICSLDKETFTVHSYEEYQKSNTRAYPYIYDSRERYTVCFNVTKTVVCRTQLIAKLLAGLYEDETRRSYLLEADDVKDIQELFAELVFSRKQQDLIDMLKHIDAKICLESLNEMMRKKDDNN